MGVYVSVCMCVRMSEMCERNEQIPVNYGAAFSIAQALFCHVNCSPVTVFPMKHIHVCMCTYTKDNYLCIGARSSIER